MEINVNLILAIILSIVSVFVIHKVKVVTKKFGYATLTAVALGLILGAIFKDDIMFIEIFGKGYMSLIKMIIVPLVMVSLITSIIRLKDLATLRSMGAKTLVVLLGTTGIAAAIGIVIANLFNLGKGLTFTGAGDFEVREIPTFTKVIMDMLPSNPIASIADNKIIPVIVFSIFIAIALMIEINRNPEGAKPFKDFVMSAYNVVMRITKMVLKFIPYGVFALIATVAASNGMDTIKSLILVIAAVYIACILQIVFVHTPLVAFVAKKNPISFYKGIFPAQTIAFSSQSSYGTLPVTIKSLTDNVGVSENVASFVAPLGSTVGMNACGGLYPAIVAVLVSNVMGVELTGYSYFLIILTTIISSIGIAGVPGSATMSTTVVLSVLGLPIEVMAMVMAVDTIIDMGRTATNVTGSAVAALVVDESEKKRIKKKELKAV